MEISINHKDPILELALQSYQISFRIYKKVKWFGGVVFLLALAPIALTYLTLTIPVLAWWTKKLRIIVEKKFDALDQESKVDVYRWVHSELKSLKFGPLKRIPILSKFTQSIEDNIYKIDSMIIEKTFPTLELNNDQVQDLRKRLEPWAEDWDDPAMDVYDKMYG